MALVSGRGLLRYEKEYGAKRDQRGRGVSDASNGPAVVRWDGECDAEEGERETRECGLQKMEP